MLGILGKSGLHGFDNHPDFFIVTNKARTDGLVETLHKDPKSFLHLSATRVKVIDELGDPVVSARPHPKGLEVLVCWAVLSYDTFEVRFPLTDKNSKTMPVVGHTVNFKSGYFVRFQPAFSSDGRNVAGLQVEILSYSEATSPDVVESFKLLSSGSGQWTAESANAEPKSNTGWPIFEDGEPSEKEPKKPQASSVDLDVPDKDWKFELPPDFKPPAVPPDDHPSFDDGPGSA